MKFGVMFANVGPFASAEGAVAIAEAAEEAGFESLWTVEHVIVPHAYESAYPYSADGKMQAPADMDLPDPLIWLAYVAARTTRIRLATGILILPERNPVILAKEVATLDALSGGRVELGIGVGWLEEEFDALGVPWERRGERTDEYVAAMRELWSNSHATFDGEFSSFDDVASHPHPVNGAVPIVIGGHSKIAARRAGRIGDGFFPGAGSHEQLIELIDLVHKSASEHGRDGSAVEITAPGISALGAGALDEVKKLADLGVSRLVLPPLAFDPTGLRDALSRYGDEVISKVS